MLRMRRQVSGKQKRNKFSATFASLPAQPAQWNLFIPFHRGEIFVALISSGLNLCYTYFIGAVNYSNFYYLDLGRKATGFVE